MAGSSMKDIKTRIKSVQGTRQITKAMRLVASSKLSRAKERMEQTAPYYKSFNDVVNKLSRSADAKESVFFTARKPEKICYCVIAGDRGLAGGYNSNIFREVLSHAKEHSAEISVLPIGKKAVEFFGKRFDFIEKRQMSVSDISIGDCFELGRFFCEKYKSGELDELYLTYTNYKNVLHQEPVTVRIFPLTPDTDAKKVQIECEQGFASAVSRIMQSYVASLILSAVSRSYVSELTARQNAMDTATSNADDMISELQLQYNRARQAGITQEITEIVAGANS
ncbi:MAG: ATP synthase F1 subunit gamma [Ruminococcaceae bacterium]|nr:ATP synthase F1 subunit gamma [Oscillospiraceae bacterium]